MKSLELHKYSDCQKCSWSYSKQAGYRMNGYTGKPKKFSTDFCIVIMMYMVKHIICNIIKLLLSTNPIPNVTWCKNKAYMHKVLQPFTLFHLLHLPYKL